MIRWLLVILTLTPVVAQAQRNDVLPRDAEITVTIENPQAPYLEGELVLLTIHGIYRRHITREKLIQPDLNGFGWMQLGEDYWHDSTERGQKVKNMRRRMAVYPNRNGEIEIGAFRHRLTFLDENLKWFEHEIASDPIVIKVDEITSTADWWLPVHRLELEDSWSNPPDQLQEGEGVLRVIRVEAHGATPDMLPPMPELYSPSAHIYPHPEKRLVELTPRGPVAIGFWRWTLRPTNDVSAIVEPLDVEYFDTIARENKVATITAQRIAYGDVTGRAPKSIDMSGAVSDIGPVVAPETAVMASFACVAVAILFILLRSYAPMRLDEILRHLRLDEHSRALRRARSQNDVANFRKAAHALTKAHGVLVDEVDALKRLDESLFAKQIKNINLDAIVAQLRDELQSSN